MPKPGDIVRYLNAVGGGPIVRIEGTIAWVDDDGFETPVPVRECVVVRTAEEARQTTPQTPDKAQKAVAPKAPTPATPTKAADPEPQPDDDEIEEVPGGDTLNIVLAFEPVERTHLTETDFDASLVNDSNYYLYFILASRDDDSTHWTSRYAGIVEPQTELWLGTYSRADIALFDRLNFQYIAFKRNREYQLKTPATVQIKVDTTKFFKLHCYHANTYFDNEVLAFDLVTKDQPCDIKTIDTEKLRTIATIKPERRPERRPVNKRRHTYHPTDPTEPLVVDLHINALLDNTRGMSSADILNYQIDTFERIMKENLRNWGRRIIFIHGKGEGVLRQALTKELNNRYKGHDVQDASFQEYGYGATQVTIRQNAPSAKPRRR